MTEVRVGQDSPDLPDHPDHPDLPVKPPLLSLLALAIGYLVHHLLPMHARPAGWGAAGVALVVLSFSLGQWAMYQFRVQKTAVKPWKPTRVIVDSGPFAFTRNPIYVSFVLLQLGIGLWHDRLAVVLMTIPAAIALDRIIIRREEAYLARKFGVPYRAYMERVRRWV